jgi:hypothetical protein
MDSESGRSPGVPDRNGETSETGGYSDGKALSYSSCRGGVIIDRRSGSIGGVTDEIRRWKTLT